MTKRNKSNSDREEYERLRKKFRKTPVLSQCPEALEIVRFDTIKLSLIAPVDQELHNGVRVDGIPQDSVQQFKIRIENGEYDPVEFTPPCVMELTKDNKFYREGYRYRMVDGHTRREAHVQLSVETMDVAVVKFHAAKDKSADFWRITFMAQRNDGGTERYHSKPSTPEDKVQTAKLLIAAAQQTAPKTKEQLAVQERLDHINNRTQEIISLLNITAKSQRTAVYDAVVRAEAANDSDILKHVVHHYIPYYWNKYIEEFCNTEGYDEENLLQRPFYLTDEACSRDDYTQFNRLIQMGMDNIDNLNNVAFFGTTAECKNATDVYTARRRKSKLVENMIDHVTRMYEWLNVPKHREAMLAVPMYWLTQTYEEPTIGTVIQVDPTTGKHITKKKSTKKTTKKRG